MHIEILTPMMLEKTHFFDAKRILKPVIALALSYAMTVHGFASHHLALSNSGTERHEICVNTTKSASADYDMSDTKRGKSEEPERHDASCCLTFGSGDLPRISPLFSIVSFPQQKAAYPHLGFKHLIINREISSSSLPRAPPQSV